MKEPDGSSIPDYATQIETDDSATNLTDEYETFVDILVQSASTRIDGPPIPIDEVIVYTDDTVADDELVVFFTVDTSSLISGTVGQEIVFGEDDVAALESYDTDDNEFDEIEDTMATVQHILNQIETELLYHTLAIDQPGGDGE